MSSPPYQRAVSGLPMIAEPTCLIVGAERSGTTLLRLALNGHSELAWCREFEYAVDQLGSDGSPPDLTRYRAWLSTHRIFQSTGYRVDEELQYPQLIRDFLEQQRAREGKQLVGATVHRHFDRCLRLWPSVPLIHLVRDPRDVARSVVNMGWAGNTWKGVEAWLESERLLEKVCSALPSGQHIDVHYEALVREPEQEIRRICDFLGLAYEPDMLELSQRSTYRRPDSSLAEQWRSRAPAREIRWVESQVAPEMMARGYALSGQSGRPPGALERRGLAIHDWCNRALFRVRRNGLGLFCADWFARRLRIQAWERALRLRLNAIEARTLH